MYVVNPTVYHDHLLWLFENIEDGSAGFGRERRGWGHGCMGEDEDKDKNDENKSHCGRWFLVEGGCRYIAAELLVGAAASFTYSFKGTQQLLELEALSE